MATNVFDFSAFIGCEPLMTSKQAAAHLGFSVQSLANMRVAGTGPKFIKLKNGKVRYQPRDIHDWLDLPEAA